MPNAHSFKAIHSLWDVAQRPMLDTGRWGNFPDYGQSLIEHANSIQVVASWTIYSLRGEQRFDGELVRLAVQFHDFGEPLSGGDVLYDNKTDEKDAREWDMFREQIKSLKPEGFRDFLEQAFLLQFCRKESFSAFDSEAKQTLLLLRDMHDFESAIFEFIERFDYILSAFTGHKKLVFNAEESMYEHTLPRQVGHLDELVITYPAFEKIWTPELRDWLMSLLETYS